MRNINLLPPELRKNMLEDTKSSLKRILIGVLVGLVIMSYLGFVAWMKFSEKILQDLEAELNVLQTQVLQANRLNTENTNLENTIATFRSIQQDRTKWAVIFNDINDRLPENVWITDFAYDQNHMIQIKGVAENVAVVGFFLYQLNQLPHFSGFSLVKATETFVGNKPQTEFSLVGTLAKGRE